MFNGSLELKSTNFILKNHGIQPGISAEGDRQRDYALYGAIYAQTAGGEVEHMMVLSTVIGSGQIDIPNPYAHYLHEGILYVSPTTGSSWAKKNEIKVPTERELTYAGAPMRGKKWFDRMKADHKGDIIQAAQALIDRGGK